MHALPDDDVRFSLRAGKDVRASADEYAGAWTAARCVLEEEGHAELELYDRGRWLGTFRQSEHGLVLEGVQR